MHPRIAQDRAEIDAALDVLVSEALRPLGASRLDLKVARGMVDLNTWDALRDQELGPDHSRTVIAEMLAHRLATT